MLESQRDPDPDFSTVETPNPEEKTALKLAIERARETGAQLVIATDPDCDRMGLAFREKDGDFVLLNGHQIGSIFCHYLLEQLSRRGKLPAKPVIIKTIVTTELQKAIAESYGAELVDVLTGFKYIGEQMYLMEKEQSGRTFIFGGEESYGYLAGTYARDKDAVVSSQLAAEVAAWCSTQGKTLGDYMDDIYRKYGYYLEKGSSLTLKGREGAEKIAGLMEHFRIQTPERISGRKVVGVWDLIPGEKVSLETGEKVKTNLPKANVLIFYLEENGSIAIRPSGTEPKVKFYFALKKDVGEAALKQVKEDTRKGIEKIETDLMAMAERFLE